MLRKFSHQKISELIRKTRVRKYNQMLTDILLHKLTNFKSHLDIFRAEKSSNHLNQKKNNDSRHILSHNLKKHNENHFYNSKKMTQADQYTQNSENTLQSVS